jgi:hypothetical protein
MDGPAVSRRLVLALAAIALWPAASVQGHHAVLRFNLEEMTLTADRVFIGRCVRVVETTDLIAQGRLPVTRYTFQVERTLKGNVPSRITFTQLGHPGRPAKGGVTAHGKAATRGLFLHGMSTYAVGDRMMLFLIPDYQEGKLTYPVGLEQGAFRIEDDGGAAIARNNLNNIGLFDAPFNSPALRGGGAKVVRPEAREPLAGAAGLSPVARGLAQRRGGLPVGALVELVGRIQAAHSPKGGM